MPSMLARLIPEFLSKRFTLESGELRTTRGPGRWSAGEYVSADTALTLSAVWRSTSYISQTIAMLPWAVRQRKVNGGSVSSTELTNHPVTRILDKNSSIEQTAFSFREAMYVSALNWGNGYAEIERDMAGRPINLWFIAPDRVRVRRYRDSGNIYYEINNGTQGIVELAPAEILHLHGLGFDGLVGYNVIAYASRTLGMGVALEEYGGSFFKNGSVPVGVLSYPKQLSKPAKERLRESWEANLKGARRGLKTVVLEDGLQWNPTAIPNDSAQFIESRKFTNIDVCRWYGVPPNKLFDWDKSTYNNFEQANREVVIDTLLPWIRRFEEEVDRKLLARNYGGLYSKMNVRELLRGDPATRSAYYTSLFKMASISPNEVREEEGRNPIEDGDRYFIAANNLVPLDRIDELDRLAQNTPTEPAQIKPRRGGDDEDDEDDTDDDADTDSDTNAAASRIVADMLGEIQAEAVLDDTQVKLIEALTTHERC